jgi:hypothetical protein
MKKIIAGIIFIVLSCIPCLHVSGSVPSASIAWNETEMDFGRIPHNKPIMVEFRFQNPGMIPLVITDVKPSCGCTVADFPKEPIPAGGEGSIRVTFDARSTGYFSKTITVHSNTEQRITNLFIKGEVEK